MKYAHPAYAALRSIAEKLSLPRRFKRDLIVHDRRAIRFQPVDRPFLWAIHEDGTHLVWLDPPNSKHSTVKLIELVRAIAEINDGIRWFRWDGIALIPYRSRESVEEYLREEEEKRKEALQ